MILDDGKNPRGKFSIRIIYISMVWSKILWSLFTNLKLDTKHLNRTSLYLFNETKLTFNHI